MRRRRRRIPGADVARVPVISQALPWSCAFQSVPFFCKGLVWSVANSVPPQGTDPLPDTPDTREPSV